MFYSNGFERTYDELISFYPLFYREVLEMRAILEADGRILDQTAKEICQVLDNAFIDTADEETIEKFEKFLRIKPDSTSSYEERRRNVKLYFTGFGKISASKLKEMLFSFTETEANITFTPADESGNNLLYFEIPRGSTKTLNAGDLLKLLARRIPAHLWYEVNVVHTEHSNLFFGVATVLLKETEVPAVIEDISTFTYLVDENDYILADEYGSILII